MQMTIVVEVILIVVTARKIIELKKIKNSAKNFQLLRKNLKITCKVFKKKNLQISKVSGASCYTDCDFYS